MSERAQQEPRPSPPSERVPLGRIPFYLWPNLLSLDAVAVAVVWLWCFSEAEKVPILRPIYYSLGLVVWLIYTSDRLLDARRMKDVSKSTPRHRFAKRFFWPLAIGCLVVLVNAIWMVLNRVSFALLPRGGLIALMVVIYFLFRAASRRLPRPSPAKAPASPWAIPISILCFAILLGAAWFLVNVPLGRVRLKVFITLGIIVFFAISILVVSAGRSGIRIAIPKEIFAGVIFGLGVTFPVYELPGNFVYGVLSAESLLFMMLCILNCIAISVWESEEDTANDGEMAIGDLWPGVESGYIKFAFVLAVVAAWLGGREQPLSLPLISVALSAALIGAIGLAGAGLSKNLRRALVDLALLSPLIVVPVFSGG